MDVFERLLQVNAGSTDNIVTLKEVTIISLNSKSIVLPREHLIELKPIVKACLSRLTPEMRVRLKRLLIVKERFDKNITSAFDVHHLDVLGVPDD